MRRRLNTLTQSYTWLARLSYIGLFVTGSVLLAMVYNDYQRAIKTSRVAHQAECIKAVGDVKHHLNEVFKTIYLDLRMVARLPGVRDLDTQKAEKITYRGGSGLEENSLVSAREIYNSLASNVAVSELYIVPANFDPDADPNDTGRSREPWATFDDLILSQSKGDKAHEAHDEGPEEVEIFEYRLMRRQLAWLRQHYPSQRHIDGLDYPAISGPEVVTCDNRYYSANDGNDDNRKGLVISVPFYSQTGELRGIVSVVLLSRELKAVLPNGDYAVSEPKYGYLISGGQGIPSKTLDKSARLGVPDKGLAYSMTRKLDTHDAQGDWVLWMGQPDARFWSRQDAIAAVNARNIGFGFVAIFFLTAGPGLWLILRGEKQLKAANTGLEEKVRDQTEQLRRTLDAYQSQTHAIDQHAGVLITDVRGIITHANSKLCELSGFTVQDLTGQHWKLLDSENLTDENRQKVWSQLARGNAWQGELEQRTRDGCHYWVNATTVPICDQAGQITQYISVRTDISQYKHGHEDPNNDTADLRESA